MLPDYAEYDQAIGLDFYDLDPALRFLLDLHLPDPSDRAFAEEHVARFGKLVGTAIAARAEMTDKHGPELVRYDRTGAEVGLVVHHPTWEQNKADLVRNGFVSLETYAGRPVPAVVSAAIAYLVSQAETAIYCGLGMTSAAIDMVRRYAPPEVRDELVSRLTSLDPEQAWEAGMFLTERQGGSDVGSNTTTAVRDGDEWRLFGEKHFCSNVDAELFVVLARPEGAPEGTRGLATFFVPRLAPDGSPNGFRIKRLKPKLGTIGVPTAEVSLEGARAWLAAPPAAEVAAGPDGPHAPPTARGINRMMEMVNASRFGVALMGLGIHRRSFLEAAIYAANRRQFGRRIDEFPLVRDTLVGLLVELEAGLALAFECAGAQRRARDPEEGAAFRRIAIPLAKVRCTRAGLEAASQALEVFGGNGYMEDWPMARQLRDAQCHTIWEGTENICCLDVRRAILGQDADRALLRRVEAALDASIGMPALDAARDGTARALEACRVALGELRNAPEEVGLLGARRLAELLATTTEAALLVEQAAAALGRDGDARKAVVAGLFVARRIEAHPLRGLADCDRRVIDLFEPLVRYGPIEASEALGSAAA
jgi:acyl-CoA dehydrogenase